MEQATSAELRLALYKLARKVMVAGEEIRDFADDLVYGGKDREETLETIWESATEACQWADALLHVTNKVREGERLSAEDLATIVDCGA